MNIFILDTHPVLAAQMQCDKHVVKMVLETAQILSTVTGGPYKPTHAGHPCVIWAGHNRTNFNWLIRHGLALGEEYTFRYGKKHKSHSVIEDIDDSADVNSFPVGVTEFVQCMPESIRMKDPVEAYRKYYLTKTFARWDKSRPAPYWWSNQHD